MKFFVGHIEVREMREDRWHTSGTAGDHIFAMRDGV